MSPRAPRGQIAHANIHRSVAGARRLLKDRPLAAGVCEAVSIEREIGQLEGYDPFFGGRGHSDPRWGDTAVLRREKGTRHLGSLGLLISEAVEPEKVAGLPRFISTALFDSEALGRVALTEIHNHWIGPANENAEIARVAEAHEGAIACRRIWGALEGMGFANVIVGDINIRAGAASPEWTTTWEVFTQLGFYQVKRGLDGAGISPRLHLLDVEDIPQEELHSDHDGFLLTLERASR